MKITAIVLHDQPSDGRPFFWSERHGSTQVPCGLDPDTDPAVTKCAAERATNLTWDIVEFVPMSEVVGVLKTAAGILDRALVSFDETKTTTALTLGFAQASTHLRKLIG